MRELAIQYLRNGYIIIPVGKDKRPLISWKQFQSEMPTEKQVNQWWDTYPEAQVGIVTGALSDLTVIDVEEGGDMSIFMPLETRIVKTGGGGYHIYFDYEPTITNAVRTLPLTDVRSEGGYVVAAGSVTDKGSYSVVKDAKPMKMPVAIRTMFEKKPYQAPTSGHKENSGEMPVYSGEAEGGRNDSLTRYAGKVLATMAPMYWESVALPMIMEANKKNSPPLPDYEVRLIYKSISERELPKSGERRYGGSVEPAVVSVITEERPVSALMTLPEAAAAQPLDFDNRVATNIDIFDEALLGGMAPGDLVIVMGRSGIGKTTFAQDLTASFIVAEHPALWFSYEVMAVPLYRKFMDMGISDDAFSRLFVPAPPLPTSFPDIKAITDYARKEKNARLLVVDHMGFIDVDDKKNSNHALAVTHIARSLKQLAIELGITVVLPVHVRKVDAGEPSLEDVKDSYGIVQEADTVFIIDRKRAMTAAEKEQSYYSDYVQITLAKNRVTGVSKSGTFSLVSGRYAYQEGVHDTHESPREARKAYKKHNDEMDDVWNDLTKNLPD